MGNLDGTTVVGGLQTCDGSCGVVFEADEVQWQLDGKPSCTASPEAMTAALHTAARTLDNSGNLYGTAYYGGADSAGTVYELSPSGSGWTEKTLTDFAGAAVDTLSGA